MRLLFLIYLHNIFVLSNNKSIQNLENLVGGKMKDTGIIRRIDELGRIVIPKEIRRNMRLKEGTPVQIYINKNGELTLSKYSPVVNICEYANMFCEVIFDIMGINVIVFDKDCVIATTSKSKLLMEKQISSQLEELLEERKSFLYNLSDGAKMIEIFAQDENKYVCQIIVPILANSDIVGGIVAFECVGNERNFDMAEVKTLQTIASFLARQVE